MTLPAIEMQDAVRSRLFSLPAADRDFSEPVS
jgi:hypothetical protein